LTMYQAFLKEDSRFAAGNIEKYSAYYFAICLVSLPFDRAVPCECARATQFCGCFFRFRRLATAARERKASAAVRVVNCCCFCRSCWIKYESAADSAWRFTQFYLLMWVAVAFDSYVCWHVWHKLKNVTHAGENCVLVELYLVVLHSSQGERQRQGHEDQQCD
jgi:hypothetical protein